MADYAIRPSNLGANRFGEPEVTLTAYADDATLWTARIRPLNLSDQRQFLEAVNSQCDKAEWNPLLAGAISQVSDTAAVDDAGSTAIRISDAILSFKEILSRKTPHRERLISWLPERGVAMVFAQRGIGKTQFGLSMSISIATGTPFLHWETNQADVLYVDGEMPFADIQDRILKLCGERKPEGLSLLSSEVFFEHFDRDLTLNSTEMRELIDGYLMDKTGTKVLILDNISTLFGGISEDRKQDWEPVNAWLIRLRHRGISTVLIHHAGKTGDQRGTSSREDILDTIIALRRPGNYKAEDGCQFTLHFGKSRGISGDPVKALRVGMLTGKSWTWEYSPLEASQKEEVIELLRDGETSTKIIAEEVGCSESYVRRVKREYERESK